MQHLAQGPSRQAAGAAGAAVAAGAAGGAVAAGTAVAADKGHEHLHHRCPNHQCIGRHHHQGLLLGYLRREKGCGKPVDDTM